MQLTKIQEPSSPEKKPRITKKVRIAIQALVDGKAKNNSDAAEQAGISRQYFQKKLNDPAVLQYMNERVLRSVVTTAPRAAAVKRELLDSPNEMVRDRASSFVLGVAGIRPEASPASALGSANAPGVVIQIITAPASTQHDTKIIDVTPNGSLVP
jgi:hypothetical protein